MAWRGGEGAAGDDQLGRRRAVTLGDGVGRRDLVEFGPGEQGADLGDVIEGEDEPAGEVLEDLGETAKSAQVKASRP